MSLIADWLSKIKNDNDTNNKVDIPPHLKRVVSSSSRQSAVKKRMLFIALLIGLFIGAGYGAVYFLNSYVKPLKIPENMIAKKTPEEAPKQVQPEQKPIEPVQPAPPAPPVQPIQPVQPAQIEQKPVQLAKAPVKPSQETPVQKVTIVKEKVAKAAPEHPIQKASARPKTVKSIKRTKPEAVMAVVKPAAEKKAPEISTQGAIKSNGKMSKEDNENRDAYIYTARTYDARKDYQQALNNYKKALELEPQNYIVMNNTGSIMFKMGQYDDAVKMYKNALAVKKDYVPSLINLGIAYIRTNNQIEGEGYLTRALSVDPASKNALLNLAVFQEKRDNYDSANKYFSELYKLGDAQGYLGLARIAEKQGRITEAVRAYKEFLTLPDMDPQTRRMANERVVRLTQSQQ